MANDLVVKNNALIDASYTLSLVEQRLIGLALVKANNQHQEITSDTVLTIHAGEYAEQFKVDGSVAYRALKEASERLFLRYFSYTLYGLEFGKEYTFKRPKKLRDCDIPTVMKSRWVQKIGYTESEGLLHFNLPVMLSYWLLIQKNISQAITYHKLPTLPVPTLLDCLNS